jgi:hypothetical protein
MGLPPHWGLLWVPILQHRSYANLCLAANDKRAFCERQATPDALLLVPVSVGVPACLSILAPITTLQLTYSVVLAACQLVLSHKGCQTQHHAVLCVRQTTK